MYWVCGGVDRMGTENGNGGKNAGLVGRYTGCEPWI